MELDGVFDRFARSDSIGSKPYCTEDVFAGESLFVARSYASYVSGLRNKNGDELNISCGFLTDYGLNGVVGIEQETHCCGLDFNLVGAILDLTMTAMSVAELMPDIGDPGVERTDRVRNRNWPMGYALVTAPTLDDRQPIDRLTKPLDLSRRRCGVYLQLVALDLLWRHEIAHALLGHVKYVGSSRNLKVLHERSKGGHTFDALPLEVEADKHALLSCLDTASQSSVPYLVKGLSLSQEQRIRCTLLAACLVCWFWAYLEGADRRSHTDDEAGESHPPPGLRIMQLLSVVTEYFTRFEKNPALFTSAMNCLHDDLEALAASHQRFGILDPGRLYAPERATAAARAHKIVAQRREIQSRKLQRFRFFD